MQLSKVQAFHKKTEMVQKLMHRSNVHNLDMILLMPQENYLKDSSYEKISLSGKYVIRASNTTTIGCP
jgi:cellobiose-specific phosphotransferase system component IIB